MKEFLQTKVQRTLRAVRHQIVKILRMGNLQGKKLSSNQDSCGDLLHSILPGEMILHILSFLQPKDLIVVALLGRPWKLLAENDQLWKGYCYSFLKDHCEDCDKPDNIAWKTYYKQLACFTFEDCGSSLQLTSNKRTIQVGLGGISGHIAEMAVGRVHTMGKHKYTLRINNNTYVGVGVASPRVIGQVLQGDAVLHKTEGCSVYYYTGYWYGRKGDRNVYSQFDPFSEGDKIDVFMDVDERLVKYFKGEKLLLSCKTHISNLEKGMRIAVVLGHSNSSVSIVGYTPVSQLPKDKRTERELKSHSRGHMYSNNTYV
jgi:hypothetical protein